MKTVPVPAVPKNSKPPEVPSGSVLARNVWLALDSLMTPEGKKVKNVPGGDDIVYGPAPELKTTLNTWTSCDNDTSVTLEKPKVAVSEPPSGTVLDDQLAAVFQSSLTGFKAQVPLPARVTWTVTMSKKEEQIAEGANRDRM
jgi:hypothetical protein